MRHKATRLHRWSILLLSVTILLGACRSSLRSSPTPTSTPLSPTPTPFLPTSIPLSPTSPPSSPVPALTDTPLVQATATEVPSPAPPTPPTLAPLAGCRLGTGLGHGAAPVILANSQYPALVMAPSYSLAEVYFPDLEGWIRVLGAPSLETLERQAKRAQERGLAYEAVGYGLEAGKSTPDSEWLDIVKATGQAREVADRYGKLLVMGPGLRLMSENEGKYAAMAALSDIWVLQTQRIQIRGPGESYRQEVERIASLIRAGNPDIQIWAQITLLPDREPDAEEWLAWRESINDVVEGTYLGVYLWGRVDDEQLTATMRDIYTRACSLEP